MRVFTLTFFLDESLNLAQSFPAHWFLKLALLANNLRRSAALFVKNKKTICYYKIKDVGVALSATSWVAKGF